MKKLILLFILSSGTLLAQYENGEELLRAMHKKYYLTYCQTVTFDQRTTRYDTLGTIRDTSYWYEWISYPDKFRIDFGKRFGGNCVIFRNDSAFNYRNHKLMRKYPDQNDLLLLLGGMYHRPFDSVVARLERLGYDLDALTMLQINGKTFYVVSSPDKSHQFWVDKKDLKVIRLKTKLSETDELVIEFDGFKKTCRGFTETKVTAHKNGKLEQTEEYLNLKTGIAIPDSIFYKK
jgi:outer membrane lipoprotein-sorting protein